MDSINNLWSPTMSACEDKGKVIMKTTHLLPTSNLGVVPNSRNVVRASSLSGDVRRLSYEKRSRDACALSVILDMQIRRDMRFVCTEASQGGEDDAMREF